MNYKNEKKKLILKSANDTIYNNMFKKSFKDKTDTLYNKMDIAEQTIKAEFNDKKSKNINKIMKIEDILKMKCRSYGKEPFGVFDWTKPKYQSKKYKANKSYNVGIVCSPESGVYAVDLDFYTKYNSNKKVWDKFEPETNPDHALFYKTFGKEEQFIKEFDTFTQKTPNGGIHLLFKHEEGLIQTSNKNLKIDTRGGNTNGYIVGYNSVVNNKQYTIVNNADIKPLPKKLKEFLIEHVFDKTIKYSKKKKDYRKGRKGVSSVPNKDLEVEYSYDISDFYLRDIIEKLPDSYFDDFTYYFIFTSAMKQLNRVDLWREYTNKKVDKKHLLAGSSWKIYGDKILHKIKNRPEKGIFYFEHLAKQADRSQYINYIKYKALPKPKTKPDKEVDLEKLGYGLEITTDKDMIIKSDTGTGKTTLFKNYIKKTGKKFISIVSRRSLAMEQYNDFNDISSNVLYYEHEQSPKYDKDNNMVICIDSLLKIQSWDFSNYVIFLDEFDSIIKYLISSPTLADRRTELFLLLVNDIFMNANSLIMVDADISDITHKFIRYIKKFREDQGIEREFEYIKNMYTHNKNTPCCEYFSTEKLITKARKTQKYLFATDSKEQAINLYKQLHTNEKPVLLLIAEDNIAEGKELFPKLSQHPRIIFSPKIIYGLDSDGFGEEKEPRAVFAYYKEHTISPSNMLQQINRERRITELNYMFEKKRFIESDYMTVDDMKEDIIKDNAFALKSFELEDDDINKMFVDLLIDYTYILDCYNSNKYTHFKVLLKERGFVDKHNTRGANMDNKFVELNKKKKNVKKYKLDAWDTADALNSRLNEGTLKIFNTADINKHKNLFLDAGATDRYLLTKKIYLDSDIKTANKLAEDKDFAIMKMRNAGSKIEFIKSMEHEIGVDKFLNTKQKEITEEKIKEINIKYKKIFSSRNKDDIQLDTEYNRKQFVGNLLKNVLGKEILKKKKVRKGKKTETEVNINQSIIDNAEEIKNLGRTPHIKGFTLRDYYGVSVDVFEDKEADLKNEIMEELEK